MSKNKLVWSDEAGDLRKSSADLDLRAKVFEKDLELSLRRLSSGKGRVVIEIMGLPDNKKWCQKLAKGLKKSLAVGGSYKNNVIEIHGEKLGQVIGFLEAQSLKYKKIGG